MGITTTSSLSAKADAAIARLVAAHEGPDAQPDLGVILLTVMALEEIADAISAVPEEERTYHEARTLANCANFRLGFAAGYTIGKTEGDAK